MVDTIELLWKTKRPLQAGGKAHFLVDRKAKRRIEQEIISGFIGRSVLVARCTVFVSASRGKDDRINRFVRRNAEQQRFEGRGLRVVFFEQRGFGGDYDVPWEAVA